MHLFQLYVYIWQSAYLYQISNRIAIGVILCKHHKIRNINSVLMFVCSSCNQAQIV